MDGAALAAPADAPSRVFAWELDGVAVRAGYDVAGAGPTVLKARSSSTVSSRTEMAPLAALLAPRFRTVAVDWPGFGAGTHPRLKQAPALHHAFLDAFVAHLGGFPLHIAAAGHAAGYALSLARRHPGAVARIALLAPTWRGPLPTMMGGQRPLQRRVRAAIDMPVVGHALYRLNVAMPVLRMMYGGHVVSDRAHLTPEFLAAKAAIARRAGGRFGSGAFVTGGLDMAATRDDFLRLLDPPPVPVLVLSGPQTPPRSAAEIAAMAAMQGVRAVALPAGALGVHEEHAAAVAPHLLDFFADAPA